MELYKTIEQYVSIAWKRFALLALVCAAATIMIIGADMQLGLFAGLQGKAAKSAGKLFGKFAEVLTVLAAAYYCLREGYRQVRKQQFRLPRLFEDGIRALIRFTRLIHPLCGFIILCLTVLHGYLLFFVWNSGIGKETVSGIVPLIILIGVSVTGWMVYGSPQAQQARKTHYYLGWLFVILYLLHKVLSD